MKYSLQSLMILVTMICVALGAWVGRVDYLRRWAVFHEAEENRLLLEISASRSTSTDSYDEQLESLRVLLASVAIEKKNVDIVPGRFCPRLVAHGEMISLFNSGDIDLWVSAIHERHLRDAYRNGMSRPWLRVVEPSRVQITIRRTP